MTHPPQRERGRIRTRFAGLPRAPALLAASTLILACQRNAPAVPERRFEWPVPADDGDESCADVADLRACWRAGNAHVVVRPLPGYPAASAMGWRCIGAGRDRRCRDRSGEAPRFTCDGSRCSQRHARLPDDGEWSCADAAGAVVCTGGGEAAGVVAVPGRQAAGWLCGKRNHGGETVCVDLSPDFPDGQPRGWRCRTVHTGAATRLCERDPGAHVLGDVCDRQRPCVDGSQCTAGRCVPDLPRPACFFDGDCVGGACRFGTCREDRP